MPTFKCRFNVPEESPWIEVEESNPGRAANEFHNQREFIGLRWNRIKPDGSRRDTITFAVIEVEGHGEFISRLIKAGLYRGGGVKRPQNSKEPLKELANKLGWTKDPNELLTDGWDEEESEWQGLHR